MAVYIKHCEVLTYRVQQLGQQTECMDICGCIGRQVQNNVGLGSLGLWLLPESSRGACFCFDWHMTLFDNVLM